MFTQKTKRSETENVQKKYVRTRRRRTAMRDA